MTEKRALVTGAGKRLGAALAVDLARRGHDVAVHYHGSSEGAAAVAHDIEALGRKAATLQADLTDEAQVAPLVERAAAALGGPLNVLVNNASIYEHDTLRTASRESWDRHMESNLRAPVVLTQAFAAQAPRAPRDHEGDPLPQALVVNMVDTQVHRPSPERLSYTVAKMGLHAFTTLAAQDLAPDIRVNAIGPGWTLPDAGQDDAAFLRSRAAVTPGRGPRPGDICAALGYLLDSPAVTGQTLIVDGGQQIDWWGRRRRMQQGASGA